MTSKTNDRITISGVAPKFDEAVLKQRQAARHNQYHLTSESYAIARGSIPFEFLARVIDLANQGYELSDKRPVITDPMSYAAHMLKPEAIQQADLEVLDEQVKREYILWLESEHARYKELLTEQLLQAAEVKEKQKEEAKRAKLLESIRAEVNDAYGEELVIP